MKFAIQYGYQVVPVITTRQHQGHWTFDYFYKIRLLLNKIKVPGVFFIGKWGTMLPDWNLDISFLLGAPI